MAFRVSSQSSLPIAPVSRRAAYTASWERVKWATVVSVAALGFVELNKLTAATAMPCASPLQK